MTAAVTGINFMPYPDMAPRKLWHHLEDDFDFYLATSWVVTLINSSGPAIGAVKDGALVFTNTSAALDSSIIQARDVVSGQVANHWVFDATKRMYFGICLKVSDATNCNWFAGLTSTNTTPLTSVVDGIFFRKTSAAATVDCGIAKSSTLSSLTSDATVKLVAATYTVLEFYFDSITASGSFVPMVQFYKDGVSIGALPLTNVPTVALSLNFGMANVNAVANTMSVDWVEVWQERG